MKTRFFIPLLAAACCFFNGKNMHASEVVSEKIYIDIESVQLTGGGIYIECNGSLLPVDSLHHDENGFFVETQLTEKGGRWCYRCGREHYGRCKKTGNAFYR